MRRPLLISLASISIVLFAVAAPAFADTYIYDPHGRLRCINFTAGGSIAFEYDAAGNRTSQTKSTSTCS